MTYDKVGDNKQECFVFVGNSPHAIKQHLDKQIKDGYTIANISHAVTKHGYEDVYSCIVIANK